MRTLLVTLSLAFLKAQLPPLPDTLWRGISTNGISDWTEYRIWRSRSSPLISESWRRIGPSTWELHEQDTLLLNSQGQIERYVFRSYYTNDQNQRDSSAYQALFSYPTPTQTQVELQEWDKNRLRWQPIGRYDWVAPSQDPSDVLASFIGNFLGDYLYPAPSLYRRAHIGDTLRFYEWDTTSNPPTWVYLYGYARKSGVCDSLIELPSGTSWDISFCFDSQGKLHLQRDSTASDTSVRYRFVFYEATGRVVKDSSEALNYNGQGNLEYNSRRLITYTYDNQGRLSEVEELSLSQQGGPLRRIAGKPFSWQRPPLRSIQSAQADTVLYYWRYVYSAPASVEGLLRSGCFSYAMPSREGRFGCLAPTAKVSLSLYDLSGRLLWQGEVTGTQPTFRLPESLPAGLYLLRVGESYLRLYLTP